MHFLHSFASLAVLFNVVTAEQLNVNDATEQLTLNNPTDLQNKDEFLVLKNPTNHLQKSSKKQTLRNAKTKREKSSNKHSHKHKLASKSHKKRRSQKQRPKIAKKRKPQPPKKSSFNGRERPKTKPQENWERQTCTDQLWYCSAMKQMCHHRRCAKSMEFWCVRTCGLCMDEYCPATSTCAVWARQGMCKTHPSYFKIGSPDVACPPECCRMWAKKKTPKLRTKKPVVTTTTKSTQKQTTKATQQSTTTLRQAIEQTTQKSEQITTTPSTTHSTIKEIPGLEQLTYQNEEKSNSISTPEQQQTKTKNTVPCPPNKNDDYVDITDGSPKQSRVACSSN